MILNMSEDSLPFLLKIVVIIIVKKEKKKDAKKRLSHTQAASTRKARNCLVIQGAK